jgi:Protein of unknown function (DUF2844)
MTRHTFITIAAISAFALLPVPTFASLGGTIGSVEADRVQMKAAQLRIIQAGNYRFHELQSPTGVTIREYYGSGGTVFGIAWEGPWPPDMRQLLGSYFAQFQRANDAARGTRRTRGVLVVDDGSLVVQIVGRSRAFSGFAYAPRLLPLGVQPAVIR